jgi:glycosyltransferase involved in cell wall biosynthesis
MPSVLQRCPDAHLVIVGDGSQSDTALLDRRISSLGLSARVSRLGYVKDVAAVYRDLDIFCLPSWEEPFGLVVVEAMAMGLPVIGFDAGALPELVRQGTDGILVPARDSEALAGAVTTLLGDDDLRRRLGRNAAERVRREFTPARQGRTVLDLYGRVLNSMAATAMSQDAAL